MTLRLTITRLLNLCIVAVLTTAVPSLAMAQAARNETGLDRYVHQTDPAFSWKVVSKTSDKGLNSVVLDVVSQNFLTPEQVDRTQWQHWVVLSYPDTLKSNIGFLFIDGGSNSSEAPSGLDPRVGLIARSLGAVVAQVKCVPNQPLTFHNDGHARVEDNLIGYTWQQFLQTGDPKWPAQNAMVKSSVRAMDAVSEFFASEEGGKQTVNQFVVAGGSKRGWTTWLTAAVDPRVVGIVPIVIDVLNLNESMRHHFAAYGFWAPAVGNYVQHQIMQSMGNPRLLELYQQVDPFSYRDRYTMPKYILNAAGDEFFLPDSSQFYWDELKGPKALCYVPNQGHGINDPAAIMSVAAFYSLVLRNQPLPDFQWEITKGGIQIKANDRPKEIRLWQATNPESRDFRVETLGKKYTSQSLELDASGGLVAKVPEPEHGWTAYFVEATYDVGAPFPLKVTSGVHVVPEILPFADKNPVLPTSVTAIATGSETASAELLEAAVESLKEKGNFPNPESVKVLVKGGRCYVNWSGSDPEKMLHEAEFLAKYLEGKGCKQVNFQLESGPEITLPPALETVDAAP